MIALLSVQITVFSRTQGSAHRSVRVSLVLVRSGLRYWNLRILPHWDRQNFRLSDRTVPGTMKNLASTRTFFEQLECGIWKFPNWNRIWNRFYFWTYLYHSWSTAVSFVSFNRQLWHFYVFLCLSSKRWFSLGPWPQFFNLSFDQLLITADWDFLVTAG